MGNEESYDAPAQDPFLSYGYARLEKDVDGSVVKPIVAKSEVQARHMVKMYFEAVWSRDFANGMSPAPRVGFFSCYDKVNNIEYIGYGTNKDGEQLNDVWAYSFRLNKWKEIKLKPYINPRSGSSAAWSEGMIFVFGGIIGTDYIADLHVINTTTGEVKMIETTGSVPSSRTTPLTTIYNNKFYVWGGFNLNYPNELHVLNLETLQWVQFNQDVPGRTAAPFVCRGEILYSYGNSRTNTLLTINLDECKVSEIATRGSPPISSVMSAGMTIADNYIFYFGGKYKHEYTLLYALDLSRMWWFVFHVRPDNETVTIADGFVEVNGIFMIPRIDSFSMQYDPEKRRIIGFLGQPLCDPPSLLIFDVGEAFGCLHLREDLRAMLRVDES